MFKSPQAEVIYRETLARKALSDIMARIQSHAATADINRGVRDILN